MTLPPDHPITKHVERIVRRIITANNLGTLVVDNVQNQSKDAGFSSGWGGGEVGAELDSEGKEVGKPYGPGKTWDVIVINDPHTINAAANPGMYILLLQRLTYPPRSYHGLYRHTSHLQRRRRTGRSALAWYVLVLAVN